MSEINGRWVEKAIEGAMLRPGNVHSADRWKELLVPIVRFYNGRGITEQWIKEGKYALNRTRLSYKHFLSNQVRLGLFVLAYNLGNFLRRLVLPGKVKHWSLRTLLVKLIKIGAKVLSRAVMLFSSTMLFNAMSYFSVRPEGQVSLILGFLKKSSEYQRKW